MVPPAEAPINCCEFLSPQSLAHQDSMGDAESATWATSALVL